MWGTWSQHLTSMLTDLGTQPLTLTDHAVLGEQLLPWLKTHDVPSQQDAAEFAGWFRGQLFDQHQLGSLTAGWQKRLMHSIEDQGKVLIPIFLNCSQKSSLQDLIDNWHLNDPFVYAFVQANDMICIQVNRFPSLDSKFCEPIYGSRIEVLVPIFDAAQGFEVTWHSYRVTASVLHSYRVTASVLHKGEVPTKWALCKCAVHLP